jgi:hypothetical protein
MFAVSVACSLPRGPDHEDRPSRDGQSVVGTTGAWRAPLARLGGARPGLLMNGQAGTAPAAPMFEEKLERTRLDRLRYPRPGPNYRLRPERRR